MNRKLSTVLVAAAALATALTAQAASVGQVAPDFALQDTSGKTVRLSDYKGKTVVLEWTNPGCPFVVKHYAAPTSNMQGTQKAAGGMGNVVWLAVNSTATSHPDYLSPDKMSAWMTQKAGAPNAVLMDAEGKVGQAYGAKTTPHMYIVAPDGKLAYAGSIDSIPSARAEDIAKATNYVKTALGEIKAGSAVSKPVTQPYGCSVKYKS